MAQVYGAALHESALKAQVSIDEPDSRKVERGFFQGESGEVGAFYSCTS